ncbi:MAG: glycosyltransferase family 1 protein [Bacteroidota bacterium]
MQPKEKIRVFVDAHTFDGEYQGSRTFIREIYHILAQKETLDLYIGAYDIINLQKYFPTIPADRFIKFKNRSPVIRLVFDIPSIIKKHKIHYAHFQYMVPLYKNCRYIVTVHDVLFRDYPNEFSFFYRFLKTVLYKAGVVKADILTTVSSFSLSSIQKHLGIPKERIQLVPMAVHEKYFEPYNKSIAKKQFASKHGFDRFILFVSRIEPRKNHALLLSVFIDLALHMQGYHLVLLGHQSMDTPAFTELMDNLPGDIKPFVFSKNDVSDNELLLFYHAADVFVYPSKAEGFGVPPLEAAAAKVPVICSNTSSMAEFAFFGKNHIAPEYQSVKNALQEMINESPGDPVLSVIAETIHKQYSWTSSAEQLYKLILADTDVL